MRYSLRKPIENPEGKRPIRSLTHTWDGNIKIGLNEIVYENLDWIHLAQDRDRWQTVLNIVMKFWFHKRRGFPDQVNVRLTLYLATYKAITTPVHN
jgi:hypothetical protein